MQFRVPRMMRSLFVLAVSMVACSPVCADPTLAQLLGNPGFEAPFVTLPAPHGKAQITGAVANGWQDNSGWADVTVEYAEENIDVHGGKSAQRVTVQEVRSGGAQFVQTIPFKANHVYIVSVWLKGQAGAQASVSLRQDPSPWQTYATKNITLSGVWEQVTFQGTPSADTDGYFMINPPIGSSLLIDDASLVDVTSAVSDAPAQTGNLLPDGSFEAGFGGGWSARIGLGDAQQSTKFAFEDPSPTIDRTTAGDQKQSVKVDLPCSGRVDFTSPLVSYNYGRSHTTRVWMKSDVPGATARLQILGSPEYKQVSLSPSWQQFSFSTIIPYGDATRVEYIEQLPGPGTAWIDGAELTEGSQPPKPGNPDVEITLTVSRPGGVFFDGEPAVLNLATANAPTGSTIRATCLDLYGQIVRLKTVPTTAESLLIKPGAIHPRGMFKVTAQVYSPSGKAIGFPVQQVFARLPRPRNIPAEDSYFGVHIPLTPKFFQLCRAIGERWTRVHDADWVTIWPVVEPERGQFEFTDAGVDGARAAGMAILGMFDGGPLWAAQKPNPMGGYFAVYNKVDTNGAIDEWKNYIDKVVSHYKGRIDYWEVWNEPYGEFTPGSADTYGELLKAAYSIAKNANPNAVIVGMDTHMNFDNFTDTAMSIAGGSSSYDAFSFHDYYTSLYGGPDSRAAQEASHFDVFENKYGHITPRWITESAPDEQLQSLYWPIGKEQDTRIQYTQGVRFDVTEIGAGVKHVFYYTLDGPSPYGARSLSAIEHDGVIRPIMAAKAVLASLIDGAPCLGRAEPVVGVDDYSFRRADGSTVEVIWSYDSAIHKFIVPRGSEVLDALGNRVNAVTAIDVASEPMYVIHNN